MKNNRFSHEENVDKLAESLYGAKIGEKLVHLSGDGISLEAFGEFCGQIMSTPAPCHLRFWICSQLVADVRVTSGNAEQVWDQVEINGVSCGNRHGGRQVFTRMALPYVVARYVPQKDILSNSTVVYYRDAARATISATNK